MRTIYNICEICHHLKLYNFFKTSFFRSFVCFIHGIILSNSNQGIKKIAESCINSRPQQTLSYFLNEVKSAIFNQLYSHRLLVQLQLAQKQKKSKYSFFIIDDFLFKKRKNKRTQAASYNFCHDAKKARKSQCVVSSSTIINGFHAPFKHMFYVGKKYISAAKYRTKTTIALKLLSRFTSWASNNSVRNNICLIDGFYTSRKMMEAVKESPAFAGFIGRFNKGRKIKTTHYTGLLKHYIAQLSIENDFIMHGEKLAHEFVAELSYGAVVKIIIVLDDPKKLSSSRPLITNITKLSAQEVVEYYALRWKEETYHQAIKDAFNFRTHKLRKLKVLSRYLELINVAYGLCEHRRLSKHKGALSIFGVRNELRQICEEQFILNLKGNRVKKSQRDAVLRKFRP